MKKIYFLTLLLLLLPSVVKADRRVSLVKVDCIPDLNYFAIYPLEIYGPTLYEKFGYDLSSRRNVASLEEYGMVDIYRLITQWGAGGYISVYKLYTGECVLGKNKYEYNIRPSSYNLGGKCFDFLSFRLTLKENGKILTDDLLYSSCDKWRIQRISVVPEWSELNIWTDSNTVERFNYGEPDFKPITTSLYHDRPLPPPEDEE